MQTNNRGVAYKNSGSEDSDLRLGSAYSSLIKPPVVSLRYPCSF